MGKRNKYNAKPIYLVGGKIFRDAIEAKKLAKKTHDNVIRFDSTKEYNVYIELKTLEKANEIKDLQRQVCYTLVPNQYITTPAGKKVLKERKIVYKADFVFTDKNNKTVIIDAKSTITRKNPVYIIKRKLLLHVYGFEIVEM